MDYRNFYFISLNHREKWLLFFGHLCTVGLSVINYCYSAKMLYRSLFHWLP